MYTLLLSGRETAREELRSSSNKHELCKRKLQDYKWNRNSGRLGQQSETQQSPEAILSVVLSFVVLTFCPTILCPATHRSAILANLGSKVTNSTMFGLVTSLKMMMVLGVLSFAVPQSTPPSENSAIRRIFGVQDPVCCFDESLISMEH